MPLWLQAFCVHTCQIWWRWIEAVGGFGNRFYFVHIPVPVSAPLLPLLGGDVNAIFNSSVGISQALQWSWERSGVSQHPQEQVLTLLTCSHHNSGRSPCCLCDRAGSLPHKAHIPRLCLRKSSTEMFLSPILSEALSDGPFLSRLLGQQNSLPV